MLLKPMCCRTACIALVLITLNRKMASPVSRRDAVNAELASLGKKSIKHSGSPRRPEDRTGGITVRAENGLLILVPINFATLEIVHRFIEQAYAKTTGSTRKSVSGLATSKLETSCFASFYHVISILSSRYAGSVRAGSYKF
jgi:hypothetical protein